MSFSDNFFKKIEKKTNVNKDTIINLANKLQDNQLKDEQTLRDVVKELSNLTGMEVTQEKEDKIINTVLNDEVPNNIDELI